MAEVFKLYTVLESKRRMRKEMEKGRNRHKNWLNERGKTKYRQR